MRPFITLLLLICSFFLFSQPEIRQDFTLVIAQSGLNIRAEPRIGTKVLIKAPYLSKLVYLSQESFGRDTIGELKSFIRRHNPQGELVETDVPLVGVEAGGHNDSPGQHASSLTFGKPGVLHGSFSYVLQDQDGQTDDVHSASAGLDYPGVGPEHSHWKSTGRVEYRACRDDEALATFDLVAQMEGILPALESSHAIAKGIEDAKERGKAEIVVVCLSGRGDKDAAEIQRLKESLAT